MKDILESINAGTICIGCNYHTKWQKEKGMRFVLSEVNGEYVKLYTRNTKKNFTTKKSDLIFIMTNCNIQKAINKLKK